MEKVERPPKYGYVNELARLCGCSRHTVRLALFDGQEGKKSNMVRKMYRTKYINNETII
jgi:hypothetical protein